MKDTPMTADAHIGGSNQHEYVCESTKGKMSGISTIAKFKAAQDLRIQTRDLPEKSIPCRHMQRSGSSSSSGTLSAPNTNPSSTPTSPSATSQSTSINERELDGDEDGECSPETPLPPSSTGKKRRRRTANQIDRKFACSYPGCVKAYGSEGSLTQHQRLKHRVDLANPSNQTGNFFLPLHRARNAAAASTNHTMYRQPPGSTRTVNIRPALDGMMIAPFEASVAAAVAASTNTIPGSVSVPSPVSTLATTATTASALPIDKVSTEFSMNSVSAHSQARQSLRARSNSMPVSTSGPAKIAQSPYSNRSKESTTTPRPQSTRRSRMNSTPRARTSTAAMASIKPIKRRSKSESLAVISLEELMGTHQQVLDERKSFPSRIFSDTTSPHSSYSVDIHTRTILAPPFDWPTIDMRDHSPDSSSDEAIDSDILSVLADYGNETVSNNEDTLGIVNSNLFSAMDVDDGMLPHEPLESCLGRHNSVGLTPPVSTTMAQRVDPSLSPHGGPGPVVAVEGRTPEFVGVTDDWQYLSTHLEKMTMLHEPDNIIASGTFANNEMDPFQLDIVSDDEDDETIRSARTTRGLYPPVYPQSLSRTLSSALLDDTSRSPLWTKELSANDLYMDEVDLPTFAALRAESRSVSRPLSPMYSFAKGSQPMYDRQISLGSVGSVGSLGGMNSFAADSSLFHTLDSMDSMEDVRI